MMETKKNILIVEDEEPLRNALVKKLNQEGFETAWANNGREALVTALRERPDLILLDIMLPEMDGLTMMKKLRQTNAWGKTIPIIVLTNLTADTETIIQSVVDDEPSYYLVKSDWKIADVVDKIRERLSE